MSIDPRPDASRRPVVTSARAGGRPAAVTTCHCAVALLPIRLSSTRGLSSAGSTGSSDAAATIASSDRATTLR